MAGNTGIDLEKELTCSICTDVLYQPLTLLDCLHTFCGACVREWFASQATLASHYRRPADPYTCPSCRAVVRAARPNANITTLLDLFLQGNPGRGKSDEEKEDLRKHYKPGDDVIPPVQVNHDSEDSEDERLMDEVREMSVADLDPAVAANRRAERVARDRRDHRRRQDGRSDNHGARETERRDQYRPAHVHRAHRQQDAVERNVEHQPSLRSFASVSEDDPDHIPSEMLHFVMSSIIPRDLDIDNLTPEQEEDLSQRAANEYLRLREEDRARRRTRADTTDRQGLRQQRQHHARGESNSDQITQTRTRPLVSGPHLSEQWGRDPDETRRRATSATGHQRTTSSTTTHPSAATAPAARSATDLSDRSTNHRGTRDRRRGVSTDARSNTEPVRSVSSTSHSQARALSSEQRIHTNSRQSTDPQLHTVRREDRSSHRSPTNPMVSSPIQQSSPTHPPHSPPSITRPSVNDRRQDQTALSHPQSPAFAEPKIKCNRCDKPDLQYSLHYNCPKCLDGNFKLCLQCYRAGQGCNHWFGFGYTALVRWQRTAPDGGWPADYERPHILAPRRYPPPDGHTAPADRLQQGVFCEQCLSFANASYWHCAICLEGAWGFCAACVNAGRHCTHPLTPVAHLGALAHRPHQDATKTAFLDLPHLKQDSYVLLPASATCAICSYPIAPSSTRFHCYKCNDGDYDVCTESYRGLVAAGRIAARDGPAGWRRCLQGHRMAVVGYQDAPDGRELRVTVAAPVGGWRLKDDDLTASSSQHHLDHHQQQQNQQQHRSPPPQNASNQGQRCLAMWSWFPADGVEDELAFPKFAEITEVERVNEDYSLGVYAGRSGLFPANHVREI